MIPKDLTINDISVGDEVFFNRTWNEEDLDDFAKLSGNENPLHTDEDYAKSKKFQGRLIYGMQIAVVCSTLVGMYMPGKRCICLRQDLYFKKPVYVGDTVKVCGKVKSKSFTTRILEISIEVIKDRDVVVEGTMTVQILE